MHSRQDIIRLYTPSLCFVALLRARLHHWALKHLVRASTLGHTHKQRMCMDSGCFLRLNHCGARVISGKPAEQPMESGFQNVPGCLSAKADMQISPLLSASITPPSRPKSRHASRYGLSAKGSTKLSAVTLRRTRRKPLMAWEKPNLVSRATSRANTRRFMAINCVIAS